MLLLRGLIFRLTNMKKYYLLFGFFFFSFLGLALGQSVYSTGSFSNSAYQSTNPFYNQQGYASDYSTQNNFYSGQYSNPYASNRYYDGYQDSSVSTYTSQSSYQNPYAGSIYQNSFGSNPGTYPDYYNRYDGGNNVFGNSYSGNSYNPQFYPPGYSGFGYNSPSQLWSGYGSGQCLPGQDLILQIAPGGCSPNVVRSDLLEEQNVPVFCKISALQINPLIDISRIRSFRFSGQYPPGISGVSYYPALAAVGGGEAFSNSIYEDNLGYLVVVLSRQANESTMPDFISGNITAVVDYTTENAFGIGDSSFYLSQISDAAWSQQYREYGFWNGKGYVRVDAIDQNAATISIYSDQNVRTNTVTLRPGQTSGPLYLSGFYCAAGFSVRVDTVGVPVETALLQINNEQLWVAKGDRILNNRCSINDLRAIGGGGSVEVRCSGEEPVSLSLSPGSATFRSNSGVREVTIGSSVSEHIFLALVGSTSDAHRYAVLIKDSRGVYEEVFFENEAMQVVSSVVRPEMTLSDIEKSVSVAVKNKYTQKGFTSNDVSVAVVGVGNSGFDVTLEGVAIADEDALDAAGLNEQGVLAKTYYDQAISSYQELVELYPDEKRDFVEDDAYAAQGLLDAARLARAFGSQDSAHELYTQLISDYPDSSAAQTALFEDVTLLKYNTKQASDSVQVLGTPYYISVLDFKRPASTQRGAVLVIDGEERMFTLNQVQTITKDNFVHSFKIITIDDGYLDLVYEKSGGTLQGPLVIRKRLTLQNTQETFEGMAVRLKKINLDKQVKLTLVSGGFGPRTESAFNFGVGIEKRSISLSPKRAQELASATLENMKTISELNSKLGKVVSGLKGACLATATILTLKSTLTNGPESFSRGILMTSQGGWNEKCAQLIDDGVYNSIQQCLLDKKDIVEKDVAAYGREVKKTNEIIYELNEKYTQKEGGIFGEDQIDSSKVKEEFRGIFEKWCSLQQGSVTLPGKDIAQVQLGSGAESVCGWETLTHEQRRDIMTLHNAGQAGGSEVFSLVLNKKLSGTLSEAKNFYDEHSERTKSDALANEQNLGIKTTDPYGDTVTPGYIKTITSTDLKHQVYQHFSQGDKLIRVFIPEKKTLGGGVVFAVVDSVKSEVGGKQVMVEMEFSTGDNYFVPKQNGKVYNIDGRPLSADGTEEVRRYMALVGLHKIREYESGTYENPMVHPESLRVRYFDKAPYTGLPSEIPFDIEKGWYVEMTYVLSGFGTPYDESGRVTNFYICNVGENGLIEFKQSADDICRYYNVVNPDISFPGLDTAASQRLVTVAQRAIAEAARQQGKENVMINGHSFTKGKSFGGEAGSCTDFMSIEDCTLMFNVCDPVICPASRCDYGGQYRVDNVIQSGVVGSLLLCLPNYQEGVAVPICLSGVHAGLENYVSILNSTVQCLNESVQTGRTIGICDEIKSVYLCEFFWRQAAPLTQLVLPTLFSGESHGGGEYLTTQSALENTQSAISYYRDVYATNAFVAFDQRRLDIAGGANICQGFISGNFGAGGDGFVGALLQPDSPPQFSGWISEIPLNTVTVPPTSHYKVYYHIFAGSNIGAQYAVYLKDQPSVVGVHSVGFQIVDRGYINRGGQVDQARDFTAASGFKQLCISVNGNEECGFGQVSTSYALNSLTQQFVGEQAQEQITQEKDCVAGTPSLGSLITPNIQSGVEKVINPQLYNQGIVRVCASQNPGVGVLSEGKNDVTNSYYSKWQEVGYCDDPTIKCWLDSDSVRGVIVDKQIEQEVLENVNSNIIMARGFWTYEESRSVGDRAGSFIEGFSVTEGASGESIASTIRPVARDLEDLTNFGITNAHRARGQYLLGKLYAKVAEGLWRPQKVGTATVYGVEAEVSTSLSEADTVPVDEVSDESSVEEIVPGSVGTVPVQELPAPSSRVESSYRLEGLKIYTREGVDTLYFLNGGLKSSDGSVRYRIYKKMSNPVFSFMTSDQLVGEVYGGQLVFDSPVQDEYGKELSGLIFDATKNKLYKSSAQ